MVKKHINGIGGQWSQVLRNDEYKISLLDSDGWKYVGPRTREELHPDFIKAFVENQLMLLAMHVIRWYWSLSFHRLNTECQKMNRKYINFSWKKTSTFHYWYLFQQCFIYFLAWFCFSQCNKTMERLVSYQEHWSVVHCQETVLILILLTSCDTGWKFLSEWSAHRIKEN